MEINLAIAEELPTNFSRCGILQLFGATPHRNLVTRLLFRELRFEELTEVSLWTRTGLSIFLTNFL